MWEGVFFALVVFFVAQLLLLAVGSALSRFTLARAASMKPDQLEATVTLGERLVGWLYKGVLGVAVVLFYLSLPLGMLVTVGSGWALLQFLLDHPHPRTLVLCLFVLVAFMVGLFTLVLAVFRPRYEDPGEYPATPSEHPRLFEALAEVARVARARPVARVVLGPSAAIHVREEGSVFQVLLGRGERVLHLGMASFAGLRVSELKSILAHEYGHFSHGDTRMTPVLARVRGGLADVMNGMQDVGLLAYFNPAYLYFLLVQQAFVRVERGHSRRCELLADRAAARAYGGDTFGAALSHVVLRSSLFESWAVLLCSRLRALGRPCLNLYRNLEAMQPMLETARPALLHVLLHRTPDVEDSHPSPHVRIAAVAGVRSQFPWDEAPAASLLSHVDAVQEALSARFVAQVEKAMVAHEQEPLPPQPTTPEAEARLSAAVVASRKALLDAQAGRPGSDEQMAAAGRQLEAALGEGDPALIPALQGIAREQLHLKHVSDAITTLGRVRTILLREPETDQRMLRLLDVDEQLRQLGAPPVQVDVGLVRAS